MSHVDSPLILSLLSLACEGKIIISYITRVSLMRPRITGVQKSAQKKTQVFHNLLEVIGYVQVKRKDKGKQVGPNIAEKRFGA